MAVANALGANVPELRLASWELHSMKSMAMAPCSLFPFTSVTQQAVRLSGLSKSPRDSRKGTNRFIEKKRQMNRITHFGSELKCGV